MLKYDLIIRAIRKNRTLLLVLASLVVAITTYMLVLPAFTLDANKAKEQGGIDVGASTKELEFDGGSYTVKCTLKSKDAASIQASEKEDKKAESLSVDSEHESSEAASDEEPSEKSEEEQVKETKSEDAGKAGIDLDVKELTKKDKDYSDYVKKAEKLVTKELDKNEGNRKIVAFSVYDISLMSDGEEKEPEEPVSVTLEYDKVKKMSCADDVRIVHFAVNNGKETAELLDPDDVSIETKKDGIKAVNFKAESFSVYAIVYTVDFAYEVDGETYQWSMEGNDAISLHDLVEKLHIAKDADSFIEQIESVDFSNQKLLKVCKVDKDMTLWDLKMKYKFLQEIDYWKEELYLHKFNEVDHKFKAGDYALVSIKPFDSKETLTIKMNDGKEYIINVTDAQDATMNDDGTVATITNPSGTTFDIFDYWVDDGLHARENLDPSDPDYIYSRLSWPGFKSAGTDGEGLKWGEWLRGTGGNNIGINSSTSDTEHGHSFKFSPAYSHTLVDGAINNWGQETDDGWTKNGTDWSKVTKGVNSYTMNADPRQGIIEGHLVNGYPKLTNNPSTMGTTGESLQYLFDPSYEHAGKASYTGADKLLYVDKDGYYTYDSRDYKVDFDKTSKEFTLTEQTSDDGEVRGFWPFGQQQFWLGMHMNTQFSMPTNGQVLNPKGELKDMQFEFSGDDDTWLFIDGVLVGDGGGVHNRTEIDINFAEGKAIVRGDRDPNHQQRPAGQAPFYQEQWLDDIFKAAGKYNDAEWEPIPGTTHKRFKEGTYHTFDMFYVERGGGESNLYIHYNLVSTADFTAHKTYKGAHGDDTIRRNQFEFELIGLDGRYDTNGHLIDGTKKAVMPNNADTSGQGTVESPYFDRNATTTLIVDGVETEFSSQIYRTGVTEDGNVNFGTAVISEEDKAMYNAGNTPVYRYVVREYVPDDALNAQGIKWKDATEAQKEAGGFILDQIKYDGSVHYMTAAVTRWQVKDGDGNPKVDTSGNPVYQYGLSKRYYTDSTFTVQEPEDKRFINFANEYVPGYGDLEFKKVKSDRSGLAGATFTLYTDVKCTQEAKDDDNNILRAVSQSDGTVKFEHIPTGPYYMKETQAPTGYELIDTVYKVDVVSSTSSTKSTVITVSSDSTNTPVKEIVNTKPGELTVQKKWVDQNGKETDGGDRTATVQLRRYKYEAESGATENHNVTVHFIFPNMGWNQATAYQTYGPVIIEGSKAKLSWTVNGATFYWNQAFTTRIGTGECNVTVDLNEGDNEFTIYCSDGWASSNLNVCNIESVQEPPVISLVEDVAFPSTTDTAATQTLSSSNHFAHTWKIGNESGNDFPSSNEYGPYLYYLVELKPDGTEVPIDGTVSGDVKLKSIEYSPAITDEAPGLQEGLITVTNQLPKTSITANKLWKDTSEKDASERSDVQGSTIKLQLQRAVNTNQSSEDSTDLAWENVDEPVTVTAADKWTRTFEDLSLTDANGDQFVYRIIETDRGVAIHVIYDKTQLTPSVEDAGNNTIEITNVVEDDNPEGVELPSAGGPGTHWIYFIGMLLAIGCSVMLIARRRAR